MVTMKFSPVLREGKNCWRIATCDRAAFLVDGEAYFGAVAETMRRARQTIYIIGWDIDSRVRLERSGDEAGRDGYPAELGPFLKEAVSRRKELQVHILDWDFAMLYALEREPLPIFKFGWKKHKRIHFEMDGKHPVGASQHQKLVIVDDQVAFCGGFDLASCRWDTSEHAPEDPRRRDREETYPPFHDVQLMVDGELARSLGELARERWRRATGKRLQAPGRTEYDPWPPEIIPDLEGVSVGIQRTEPEWDGHGPVHEVKEFCLEAIAAAESTIFVENQYLTAHAVGEALEKRLAAEEGPEVVLLLPRQCSGWLEQGTMGVLRARLLRRLMEADRHGRLRVFCPVHEGNENVLINVHSKVLVIDDRLVRIGSSNLSNRSMGLDSECDLAIDAGESKKTREGILAFRHRLLGEHLGTSPETVAAAIVQEGSLAGAIESLNGNRRRLEPLEPQVEEWLEELVPEAPLIDPEKPISLPELVELLAPENLQNLGEKGGGSKGLVFGLVLTVSLLLAALWRWTPLGDWLDVNRMVALGSVLRDSPLAVPVMVGVFVIGGFVLVPVTLLILVSALVFGPVQGFAYALGGGLASALSVYGIGRLLGRHRVRNLAGGRLNRISRRLAQRGVWTVIAVRLVPIAPFSVVNLVAGASHIRPKDFLLGTLLGMTPGILAISIFEEGLLHALQRPDLGNVLILVGVVLLITAGGWGLRRWVQRRERTRGDKKDG